MQGARVSALVVVPLVLLVARQAHAEGEAAPGMDAPNERRAGVVVGLGFGGGIAAASGYPNAATQIGQPDAYSASNLMLGRGTTFYVMGALTDYLNFGLWFGTATFDSSRWHSTGGGGGFRVEAFPLYRLVPKLSDLAVFTQLGVGSTTLRTKLAGNYPDADGVQSFLGIGVLHEFSLTKLFGGHIALAPTLEYDVITARSIERHGALLGARLAFYGGI
jgi:hypothetical protein